MINSGADSSTLINAGNNLNLATLTTTETQNSDWDSNNYRHYQASKDIGSEIAANGQVALRAGHDLNATAASVTAQQGLQVQAGNDINLIGGESSYTLTEHSKQSSRGLLSAQSSERHDSIQHQSAVGSSFSGETVAIGAGNNVQIAGSSVAGTQDVSITAGRDITVTTAQENHQETHLKEEKKSGLMGSGGIGFSIGQASQKSTTDTDGMSEKASIIGSEKGNTTLLAGNQLTVKGSDVVAGQDLALQGKTIAVTAAENSQTQRQTYEQKQSGLTLALSGTVGGMVNTAVQTAQTAKETEDSRLQALQGVKATLSGVQAGQAAYLAALKGKDDPTNNNVVGVSVSLGSQSSKSEQTVEQRTAQGSSLNAGRNLSLTATGDDIRVQGSELRAGQDVALDAARDIQLVSAQNSQHTEGSNKSKGGSIGLSLGAGSGGFSLSVNASMNKAKGSELGEGLSHTETLLDAGRQVRLNSGRDTTLQGAQVSGQQVTARVGRDLLLRSEQDSDVYDSKQQSMSAGVSIPIYGAGSASASFNMSKDKMHSDYRSVQEQTGLFAGQGGYDVQVGNHTQLDGAVIGSTAEAAKNRLDTGTLGFSDIENRAEFETSHSGVGISTGGPVGMQMLSNLASNSLISGNNDGNAASTTRAAISNGQLVIRDEANQRQDVAQLSNDVEHANQTLSPIFDKEKEQKRLQQMQMIAEISSQVMDIAGTHGAIIATKAAKAEADAKTAGLSDADRKMARDALATGNKPNLNPTEAEIQQYVYQTTYDKAYTQALNSSGFGTGGAIRQGIMAVSAAVQGLAGGNVAQAITGAAAPYLATEIKKATTDANDNVNIAANAVAHAVLGGIVAEASGNSALAGAAGAATGELAARVIADRLYPGKAISEMTESEKQTVTTLSLLAGGLAAGTVGDSTTNAVAGAQASQNAVENNYLSATEAARKAALERKEKAGTLTTDEAKELADTDQLDKERNQAIHDICTQGNKSGAGCSALVAKAQQALDSYGESAASYRLIFKDLYPQDAANASDILYGLDAGSITRDAAITAIAEKNHKDWNEVASEYDRAMQLHGLVSALAGFYGIKSVSKPSEATSTTTSMADRIKVNISESQKARESSNFDIHIAKSDQIQWGYKADEWGMVTLPAGRRVYGGIPGQSSYYTSWDTLLDAGFSRESIFKNLQVSPHPEFGYRPQMGIYEITSDIRIPSGQVMANPLLGPGGATQYFIKDYNSQLKLIDKIDLGK